MNLNDYVLFHAEGFLLILFRVGALFMFAPVVGGAMVPKRIRIGLALATAITLFPVIKLPTAGLPTTTGPFLGAVAREIFLGLTVGYILKLVFEGVQIAGQLIGFEMGFGIVNVIDPQSNLQVSITGHFLYITAVLLFLAMNGHHVILRAMSLSLELVPLGQTRITAGMGSKLVRASGDIFSVAVKLGAPAIALLVLTKVALGLVARTVPQMNVFIVGFPLSITIGLLGIGLSLPLFGVVLRGLFETCSRDIVFLINRMG